MHLLNQNDVHFQFNIYFTKYLRTEVNDVLQRSYNTLMKQNLANRLQYVLTKETKSFKGKCDSKMLYIRLPVNALIDSISVVRP